MLRAVEGLLAVLAEGGSGLSHRSRTRRGRFVVRDEVGSGVEVHLEDVEEGGGEEVKIGTRGSGCRSMERTGRAACGKAKLKLHSSM